MFEKCKEVADVACSLWSMIAFSDEWREASPISVFEGGIKVAFGYMGHGLCVAAMRFAKWISLRFPF